MMDRECPVCFGPLLGDVYGVTANNSLVCPNRHNTCTRCVKKLVRASEDAPSGFAFRCPMCRVPTGLSRLHMMVVVRETWEEVRKDFRDEGMRQEDVRRWTLHDKPTRSVAM